MKKGNITSLRLNPKKPPKSDWRAFDAMSEAKRHRAALSDPDCPPASKAPLARARRVPTVAALRKKLKLTQEEFAARFHLPLGTVRDWEQGAHRPDKAAQVLLTVLSTGRVKVPFSACLFQHVLEMLSCSAIVPQ
jgi:putative transcriptional regulator